MERIENNDKVSRIITSLQDYIINGDIESGMVLPSERELAGQLGVSRFSLREALRVAQAQGLIEITRGRRPRVASPNTNAASEIIGLTLKRSDKTFMDLIEARQGIECQMVFLAASRASATHISRLKETINQLEDNRENLGLCVEKDFEFHNILLEASRNIVFKIMLEPLSELLKAIRMRTIQRRGVQRAINGHKEILKAIIEKKPEMARKAMSKHLRMAKKDLNRIEEEEYESIG